MGVLVIEQGRPSWQGFAQTLAHNYLSNKLTQEVRCNIHLNWMTIMDTPDDIKNILGPNEKVELYIKERILPSPDRHRFPTCY